MRALLTIFVALLFLPMAQAEFGHELAGYPVNVDGDVVWPYIPSDWAERHGDLLADMDMQAEPLNKVNGYTAYPYYPLLTAEVQRLAADHPGMVRLSSAGQSRLGLEQWVLEIADFNNPDRIPIDEREVIYLDGGTHSNEYSGVYFVTEWAQFLLDEFETDEIARWIVENRHVYILPMVNPDGSNAFGRVNAIDVNINRNFPATWGTVAETPVINWPGPWPASEPETQNVIKLMQETSPDFVQSTHCCGNLWLHPYGASQLGKAPDFDMFTNICEKVFPDLTLNVTTVQCGEIWSTIYPASGTTADEGYAQVGASSWTYEMSGRGAIAPWGQPVIDADPREQETESWRGVMHGMLHSEKYGALPTVTSIHLDPSVLHLTVQNQGWGNITVAQVQIAGELLSVPALEPGQSQVWEIPGSFDEGDLIPVTVEWKKRIHPDSNWGRVVFNAEVEDVSGRLYAKLPAKELAPSMGTLLPEPMDVFEPDSPAAMIVTDDENKGASLVLLPLLFVALAALVLRRR